VAESLTGVDLGDVSGFRNEEELLEHMQEQMAGRSEPKGPEQRRNRRPMTRAAERQREAELQQATQSLREVYRKLVSTLHPDRELDPGMQVRKNELLQRVNRAYEAKDLLTLLEVQLEVEGVQPQQAINLSEQRLRHYNQILSEQLDSLKAEIDSIMEDFCRDAGLLWGKPQPHDVADFVTKEVRQLKAELSRHKKELQKLPDLVWTKKWLKRQQRQAEERARQGGWDEFEDEDEEDWF
jgi:hypothetical protein